MKFSFKASPIAFLAGIFGIFSLVSADQHPLKEGKSDQPADLRSTLDKAEASGSLPEGVIVRIHACLGEADKTSPAVPNELIETWEFTSNQIHRVVGDSEDGKLVYHRVESRSYDSKNVSKDLIDGKAVQIQTQKGEGPRIGLVGTIYQRGSRSIEVVWRGDTLLDLHETNGPALNFYRESDARAFGALYEKLAGKARDLFNAKPATK